ncbi:MAG TPA: terminase family protein [Candidatus Deferrimicrobium sp.]|nr:terminase family protein [Candidatus Deferrimicrobium sp.]
MISDRSAIDWRRGLTDPLYFAETVLGVNLHEGQRTWLANSRRRENILATGNRWGKSFASAVKIVHHALYRPRPLSYDRSGRYRIVTASITQEQANIIFNEAVRLIRQSPLLEPLLTVVTKTPYPRFEFGNGAVVEARSTQNRGEYLLGHDYDLFVFDEVAFETDPEYVVEEVVQMRLADREGRLDLVSTPNGRNWFYRRAREVIDGKRNGYFQTGDSRENSFISQEFLEDRLKYFSERRVQQNIMGQFVDAGGEILKGEYVDSAMARFSEVSRRLDEMKGTSSPSYLSGWDLARKRTATVGITVQVADGVACVVALERFRMFDWNVIIEKIKQRQIRYPGQLVIDATGLGDVLVEQLKEFNPTSVIFTPATKAELLTNIELMHAKGQVAYQRCELPDGPGRVWSLEDELRQARWDDNNECDALMALALALWPLRRRSDITPGPRVGRG